MATSSDSYVEVHPHTISLADLCICVLPFIVLYWLVPFWSVITIGNDYPAYSIQQQMELQYSLTRGSFPLYAPGFAGGRSAAAVTLGQMYHPLSLLAAHSPGYWSGHALEWNTFWRLISLGLTQLVLYSLLRKLSLRRDIAFVASFLTVYNLRMLDTFRYGAALESYTGFLMLCGAMAHFYVSPRRVIGPLSVMGATYLVVCGGHPQIAYFGLLGAAMVCLFVPGIVAAIRPDVAMSWGRVMRYYASAGSCVGIGLLLASAYTLPFYVEFIRDAPTRVARSYEWSVGYSDSLRGALESFFNPLKSDVHGAFGSSPLLLVAVLAPPLLASFPRLKGRATMVALWVAAAAVFLCSAGRDTPVYHLFWEYCPLSGSFRVPGRIAMLLPPMFMFILAWVFRAAEYENVKRETFPVALWKVVLGATAVFVAGYVLLSARDADGGLYPAYAVQPHPPWVDGFIFWSGVGCLLLAAVRVSHLRIRAAGWLLAIVVVLQAVVQLRFGTWVAPAHTTPTLAQMDEWKRADLHFRGSAGSGMEARISIPSSGEPSPFAAFHPGQTSASFPEWWRDATATPSGHSDSPGGKTPLSPGNGEEDSIISTYTTFNRLVFRVDAHQAGFLTLSVPYSPQWRALVDTKRSVIHRTVRNEQAVVLSAGTHEVEFEFASPASVAGMLISCLTASLVVLFLSRYCRSRWTQIVLVAAAVVVPLSGFAVWRSSLYGGRDLGTAYIWHSEKTGPTSVSHDAHSDAAEQPIRRKPVG